MLSQGALRCEATASKKDYRQDTQDKHYYQKPQISIVNPSATVLIFNIFKIEGESNASPPHSRLNPGGGASPW